VRTPLAIVVLLSACSSPAAAQTVGRDTLEGVESLWVLVEGLPPASKSALPRATVQTDVELRLRQAGLRVVEGETDDLLLGGLPHLVVQLTVMEARELTVFSVNTSLQQAVLLSGDADAFTKELLAWSEDPNAGYPTPPNTLFAPTWRCAGSLATAPGDSFAEKARQIVGNQVDAFLNDYLATNPR
jgi:hypothetical protein